MIFRLLKVIKQADKDIDYESKYDKLLNAILLFGFYQHNGYCPLFTHYKLYDNDEDNEKFEEDMEDIKTKLKDNEHIKNLKHLVCDISLFELRYTNNDSITYNLLQGIKYMLIYGYYQIEQLFDGKCSYELLSKYIYDNIIN